MLVPCPKNIIRWSQLIFSGQTIHSCLWSLASNEWTNLESGVHPDPIPAARGSMVTQTVGPSKAAREHEMKGWQIFCIFFFSFYKRWASELFHKFTWDWGTLDFFIVQLLSQLFVVPWTAAHQAPLSFINIQSLLRFVSSDSVTPSNHLTLCRPLLLLPFYLNK